MKSANFFLCSVILSAGFAISSPAHADELKTQMFYAGLSTGCASGFDKNPTLSALPPSVKSGICDCMVTTFKANNITGDEAAADLKTFSQKVGTYCAQMTILAAQQGDTPQDSAQQDGAQQQSAAQ